MVYSVYNYVCVHDHRGESVSIQWQIQEGPFSKSSKVFYNYACTPEQVHK